MAMGMSVYFKDFKNFQAEFDRQVKLLQTRHVTMSFPRGND